jgi:hypothetical protein
MRAEKNQFDLPLWCIVLGGAVFIAALALSAAWEADLRWLHFFQAWMYLAAMGLAYRKHRWGYFIGVSAAGLWAYTSLFVTTFFVAGLRQVADWVHTGHMARPDLAIAVPAWLANVLIVAGSIWGYSRLSSKNLRDAAWLMISFAASTGFFALDMALFQPRYLALFPHMLHPHWP